MRKGRMTTIDRSGPAHSSFVICHYSWPAFHVKRLRGLGRLAAIGQSRVPRETGNPRPLCRSFHVERLQRLVFIDCTAPAAKSALGAICYHSRGIVATRMVGEPMRFRRRRLATSVVASDGRRSRRGWYGCQHPSRRVEAFVAYQGGSGRVERATFGTWFGSPVGSCVG